MHQQSFSRCSRTTLFHYNRGPGSQHDFPQEEAVLQLWYNGPQIPVLIFKTPTSLDLREPAKATLLRHAEAVSCHGARSIR